MKTTLFNLHQTVAKFFEPLTKHPFLTFSVSVFIGATLYLGVDIGLGELFRQNSYDIHMLSTEQLTEVGPCFISESEEHAEIIKQYTEHLEKRRLAFVIRLLYPQCSPKKALASALSDLEKADNEESARKAIWQAGLASNQLYMLSKRFSRSPIRWFDSEDLPNWLLTELENAFVKSHELVDKLENDQTWEVAVAACIANRRTILLLFLARLGYNDEEKIREFEAVMVRVRDYNQRLAAATEDDKQKKLLIEWANSEERRINILHAMIADDMDRVNVLLTETIEKAFKEKRGLRLDE